eukprot:6666415-Lingulodinium_polyedra.AAC.1
MNPYRCKFQAARSHWRSIDWEPPAGRRQAMPPEGLSLFETSVRFDLNPRPNPTGSAGDGAGRAQAQAQR